MKHNFTDEQIISAIRKVSKVTDHNSYVANWEFEMFSQFLDALPDQQQKREGNKMNLSELPDGSLRFILSRAVYSTPGGISIYGYPQRPEESWANWEIQDFRAVLREVERCIQKSIPKPDTHTFIRCNDTGNEYVALDDEEYLEIPGGAGRSPESFTNWDELELTEVEN